MSASIRHVFTLVARFMVLLLILSLMLFASVGIVFCHMVAAYSYDKAPYPKSYNP